MRLQHVHGKEGQSGNRKMAAERKEEDPKCRAGLISYHRAGDGKGNQRPVRRAL